MIVTLVVTPLVFQRKNQNKGSGRLWVISVMCIGCKLLGNNFLPGKRY